MVLAKAAKDLPGSPISSWGDKEFTALGIESFKAQISQFVHGEQGAMLTAAKIVETVPWIDAKYYASTQVMRSPVPTTSRTYSTRIFHA